MKIKEIDSAYLKTVSETYVQMVNSFHYLEEYQFDLSETEITEAILERLKIYYETQNNIKILLSKRYIQPGTDYFVETIAFFLKAYIKTISEDILVNSERQIRPMRGQIRPDISIWYENNVIATIECKTQLSWGKYNWEEEFKQKDLKLKNEFPDAKSFLLVMTAHNWNSFENSTLLNKEFFCLLPKIIPSDYKNKDQIFTPIEGLFKGIRKQIQKSVPGLVA